MNAKQREDFARFHASVNGDVPGAVLPNYRLASEIPNERISWIWYGFLAEGKITLLDGVPKLGKSTLTADFAARVSRGLPFPGLAVPRTIRGVVMLSAEDGEADTIKPRLEASGADLEKVAIVSGIPLSDGTEGWIHLDEHLASIEALITKMDAQLVVVDPLMAYLGSKNAYKDQDMRAILGPVKAMAERARCAVVIVRHLNKSSSTDILLRGGGSVGISGAARLGMLVARDPENDDARILAQSITNLTKEQPSLRFSLRGVEGTDVARAVWDEDPAPYTSIDLLEATPDAEEKGARGEAMEFLRDALSGGERDKISLLKEARSLGISERTLRRAKEALGVKSDKRGGTVGSHWVWLLPQHGQHGPIGNVGHLGHVQDKNIYNWTHILIEDGQGGQENQYDQAGHLQERMPWEDA